MVSERCRQRCVDLIARLILSLVYLRNHHALHRLAEEARLHPIAGEHHRLSRDALLLLGHALQPSPAPILD